MTRTLSVEALVALKGQEIGISDWITIDQPMIDKFADVTQDRQFIHIDPERAKAGPFGTTIAHGFLTLSLLSPFQKQAMPVIEGMELGINLGFDRVRFVHPVSVNSRVRGHFILSEISWRKPHQLETRCAVRVEIEGVEKPALVADWIFLTVFPST